MGFKERMEELGRTLGERESKHQDALDAANAKAAQLHAHVAAGLAAFHAAAGAAGHLRIALTEPRPDDKHLRAVQFDLSRGRYRAIVTVKSRAEVTLVGPFQHGKTEGPCRSFPLDSSAEIEDALAGFVERFIDEAATP